MKKYIYIIGFIILVAVFFVLFEFQDKETVLPENEGGEEIILNTINVADITDPCNIAPSYSEVVYNTKDADYNKEFNILDLWIPEANAPTPIVMFIHGGGFQLGSKENIYEECYKKDNTSLTKILLESGVAVASIEYRLTTNPEWRYTEEWYNANTYPAQMIDAAKALVFMRSNAKNYNIDPNQVALMGGSAGGGISYWLAFHDDLGIDKNFSTKPQCIGPWSGQSTYDPRKIFNDVLPGTLLDRFMEPFFGFEGEFDIFNIDSNLEARFEEVDPLAHLTSDDPPVFMYYTAKPYFDGGKPGNIHDPSFGIYAEQFLKSAGIPYELHYPGHDELRKPDAAQTMINFFFANCF